MGKFIMGIVGVIWLFFSITVALADDCTAQFSWLSNSESDIAGYNIYYGLTDGGPYPNTVDVVDPVVVDGRILGEVPGLICDEHYYFVCTAYNDADLESDISGQVDFVVTASPSGGGVVTKVFGSVAGADFVGAIQDTFINLNDEANEASVQLNTYSWPENMVANAMILKIDLSQLPDDAQVQSAFLQLYAIEAGGDVVYDIRAHRIINHNPNLPTATGYTYDGSNAWTANTACYNNVPMAQGDRSAEAAVNSIDMSVGYKSWDITDMVQVWQADSGSNYGLLLNSDNVATADSYRNFASSEATDATLRPKLVVTYTVTVPAVPSPVGFQLLN